jgi:hypothetical protein
MSAHHLVATMWVDSVRTYTDRDVRVDLDLENHSGRMAEQLAIHFEEPGFEERGPCWQDHHPACPAGGNESPVPMPATLQAGRSIHVYATLKPLSAGRFGILAIYRWAETGGGGDIKVKAVAPESYTRAVSLDPIEVTTRWLAVLEVLKRLGEWLALPVVIALAGAAWQWTIKRHDEQYAEREKHRQWLENEREKAFQVWKEQLARIFEYTQQHYLHITRSIRGLQEAVTKARAGDARYRERVFYHFLMFRMHMRNLRDSKGGWFLMSMDAETVLSAAAFLLWSQFAAKLDDKRLDTVVGRLKRPVGLAKYREACTSGKTGNELSAAEAEYLSWMDSADPEESFNRCLGLMDLMRMVLLFESNRPMVEYWYMKKPDFTLTQFRTILKKLPAVPAADAENVKELEEKAGRYADSVEGYLNDVKH